MRVRAALGDSNAEVIQDKSHSVRLPFSLLPTIDSLIASYYPGDIIYPTYPGQSECSTKYEAIHNCPDSARASSISHVDEVCTLHRRGLVVVTASCFLTICASESLLLVRI